MSTTKNTIDMAREVGFDDYEQDEMLKRFAELIRAEEREACAKVCEERVGYWQRDDNRRDENESCAAAIRARGNT